MLTFMTSFHGLVLKKFKMFTILKIHSFSSSVCNHRIQSMAASSDVKLLGSRPSSFVNRVQFALNLKSVDYEFIPENLQAKSELLLKSNPIHKKIPVLIHNDKPISESLVIVQYIDEAFPDGSSILPSDPFDRSTARFWAAYIDDKWYPAWRSLADAKEEESKTAALEKITEGLVLLEDVFVKCSNGKGFFGGDILGYLDIVLGCYLGWLKATEISSNLKIMDEAKTPALVGWAERFKNHEAVKRTLPEPRELLHLLRKNSSEPESAQYRSVPVGMESEDLDDSLIVCQRRPSGKRRLLRPSDTDIYSQSVQ
ncbi:OLC1v1028101C1 [Oldenlandia corymbosa var. corymbosa]|uniref:glutathione transferase n=1 Tax=Oldenlandia corymbosa var. corymbosa TaxID=529605 RepID=A0AAV1CAX8_OLDCO|nr:OLC1v1028101C1 [Oldenlandia corymbosa var. corymbosa]